MVGPPSPFRLLLRGFTLIEFLVVVAIVGILAAVLTATARMAVRKAKDQQCMVHLRELGHAALIYAAENNGLLPKTYLLNSGNPSNSYFFDLVSPYLDAPVKVNGQAVSLGEIFRCPRSPAWAPGNKPHETGINAVYWDGHVEFISDPTYENIKPNLD